MEYPKYHKDIVADMLDGKFILQNDKVFEGLQQHASFYSGFFKESFGYDLEVNTRYAYLLSPEVTPPRAGAHSLSRLVRVLACAFSQSQPFIHPSDAKSV